MTIGIDASRAFRSEKTGTEWYSWHVIRSLAEHMGSSEDNLLLYTSSPIQSNDAVFLKNENVIVRTLAWPLKQFWTHGRLSLEMLIRPPDVLFIPAHSIPLIHPKRTIVTIHDVGFLRYPECYSKKDLASLRFSTAYAMRHAAAIITISEFSKKEIIASYHIDPSRIHVVGLGCDQDRYYPRDANEIRHVLEKYQLSQPYIISIGRIDARKSTSSVVRCFEYMRMNGYSGALLLVGPIGFDGNETKSLIESSPVRDHIIHAGWAPEHDKIALLCGADAMLFLSRYEGFGLPVIEAQSCGVPVICSEAEALVEIAGGAALYCDPDDLKTCALNVARAVSDPVLRAKLREAGFANAKRYTWQQTAKMTSSILRSRFP
ncbi:glycosyltransferase family 4 protein [Candidatus Uhrbacteria bacterium]|nr:glycosyltransferase family 4 protein [Candidatus Uhrbacteria bacterium]